MFHVKHINQNKNFKKILSIIDYKSQKQKNISQKTYPNVSRETFIIFLKKIYSKSL